MDPTQLEKAYQEYTKTVHGLLDGITPINIYFLNELNLLNSTSFEKDTSSLEQKYNVIESKEKVTLFNEKFAIWIVPQTHTEESTTLTMVAKTEKESPKLEFAFTASGVYNTPKFILRVLQEKIEDIIDTDNIISSLGDENSA